QHHDHTGGGGVVEQIVGQQDHAVDQVAIDKPFTDVALAVLVLRARATRHRTGVEHDRGPAALAQTGDRVLQPSPVALAGGDTALGAKAVERVVFKDVGVERLVPHWVGDNDVVAADLAVRGFEFRIYHRVAARDLDAHIVNDRVHLRDSVALGGQFLAV